MLPGAVVMNAYIKDERIIKSYTSPLSADNENHKENLVSNVVPASMHSGMNKEADKNELAELINESHYLMKKPVHHWTRA
jgi:hypothetical protein